jgi:hypothetical protein
MEQGRSGFYSTPLRFGSFMALQAHQIESSIQSGIAPKGGRGFLLSIRQAFRRHENTIK